MFLFYRVKKKIICYSLVNLSQLFTIIISLFIGSVIGIAEDAVIGGFIQFFENFPGENIKNENWEQRCNWNKGISVSVLIIVPILSTIVTYWRVGLALGTI